jgi:hypothetical protein
MQASPPRLAHGWTLSRSSGMSQALVREFIRPAVRAVPSSMARRLGPCRISLPAEAANGAVVPARPRLSPVPRSTCQVCELAFARPASRAQLTARAYS